jgi:hypothetical protein
MRILMGKQYEVIWEIFNKCSGNQMRDVFFEEIETDDPDAYARGRFKGSSVAREAGKDGALVYEIEDSGLRQRFSLTEI